MEENEPHKLAVYKGDEKPVTVHVTGELKTMVLFLGLFLKKSDRKFLCLFSKILEKGVGVMNIAET